MTNTQDATAQPTLPLESRGQAPGRGRMVGRRIVVVGAGQTEFDLDDQPVGNGRAMSLLFAREGAKVVAVDRNPAAADTTAQLIHAAGGEARALVADVADPDNIESMIKQALGWLGAIDGVAYNVGIPGPKGLPAMTPDAWDATLDVNLRGAMLTARASLPVMEPGSAVGFHLLDSFSETDRPPSGV